VHYNNNNIIIRRSVGYQCDGCAGGGAPPSGLAADRARAAVSAAGSRRPWESSPAESSLPVTRRSASPAAPEARRVTTEPLPLQTPPRTHKTYRIGGRRRAYVVIVAIIIFLILIIIYYYVVVVRCAVYSVAVSREEKLVCATVRYNMIYRVIRLT